MSRLAVFGVLLGLAMSISACGTSASSNDDPGPLAKGEYIRQADQICEGMDKAQTAAIDAFVAKRGGGQLTRAENEQMVVEIALPPVGVEVEQLEALPIPEGDEEELQAFFDEVRAAIEVGEDDPGSLADSASLGPFAKASKLGREYGFKACAFPL